MCLTFQERIARSTAATTLEHLDVPSHEHGASRSMIVPWSVQTRTSTVIRSADRIQLSLVLELPDLIGIIERGANLTEIPKVRERRRRRDVDDPAHHQSHRLAIVRFQRSIEAIEQLLKV